MASPYPLKEDEEAEVEEPAVRAVRQFYDKLILLPLNDKAPALYSHYLITASTLELVGKPWHIRAVKNVFILQDVIATVQLKPDRLDIFCELLQDVAADLAQRIRETGQAPGQTYSHPGAPGSDGTVECPTIISPLKSNYVKVKRKFVDVCKTQESPTLEDVKELCIDLIQGAVNGMPQISRQENDIEKAKTWTELARVVCFRLSKWISYDFFKEVIAGFQPALNSVNEQLTQYEDQLKHCLEEKLIYIKELRQREEAPRSMAELAVKYRLDADGLLVKDLVTERDFLAKRLGIAEHLLQVLFWEPGSVVITYWIVRDMLPLAELALCRDEEHVRAELTQHGVEEVYLDSRPSEHPGPVDQSLQTLHLQRRAIVTALDAHHTDLDVTSLATDLKKMGILTAEQCQKLASLDDKERRHEALLYTLLAHDGPDTFGKLVGCMGLRDSPIATELQATFEDLMKSPGALSVICSSQALEVYVPILEVRVKNLEDQLRKAEDQLHKAEDQLHKAELRNELNESAKKNVSLQKQLKEAMDTSLKNIRIIEIYYPVHDIQYDSIDGIDTHMDGLFHSDVRLLVV